ncbi:putative interleukin 17-like protein [Apostichopus japonicus]|uniref:Putative interleukin 17-like protein n=1 Tax=Stichopus japonicus TaxID=307972 RepID=A0A2G8JJZ4_STIJA|nr:putative interleukin 17-like protein [Apostichopus japonicus]
MAQNNTFLPITVLVLLAASGTLSFILVDVLEPIASLAAMRTSDLQPSLTEKRADLRTWLNSQQTSCPLTANPNGDVIISSCPWETVQHNDHHRRPATISKAVCQCPGCLMDMGNGSSTQGTCREIIRPMKVLRKVRLVNETRDYHYMLDIELVPVGCTCSKVDPIISRSAHTA